MTDEPKVFTVTLGLKDLSSEDIAKMLMTLAEAINAAESDLRAFGAICAEGSKRLTESLELIKRQKQGHSK